MIAPKKSLDVLEPAMKELGFIFEKLVLGPNKKRFVRMVDSSTGRIVCNMSYGDPHLPFNSVSSLAISKEKQYAYDLVGKSGYSIPHSCYIMSEQEVNSDNVAAFLREYSPLVVKPADGSMAAGVSLAISDNESLIEAYKLAAKHDDMVIAQQQFIGEEVRFLFAGKGVVAAYLRQSPEVMGDGLHTIADLIEDENNQRQQIDGSMVKYPSLSDDMLFSGLDLHAIPARGEKVKLSSATMIKHGASVYNVTDKIHHTYMDIANHIGSLLGDGFFVVDMLVGDFKETATPDSYVFLEYNLAPALQLFYSCRDGNNIDIARQYLAPMLTKKLRA